MKNIIRYIACGLSAFLMTACGDMYEIHEKYLEMGEETYLGAVQDLSAYSGIQSCQVGVVSECRPTNQLLCDYVGGK